MLSNSTYRKDKCILLSNYKKTFYLSSLCFIFAGPFPGLVSGYNIWSFIPGLIVCLLAGTVLPSGGHPRILAAQSATGGEGLIGLSAYIFLRNSYLERSTTMSSMDCPLTPGYTPLTISSSVKLGFSIWMPLCITLLTSVWVQFSTLPSVKKGDHYKHNNNNQHQQQQLN